MKPVKQFEPLFPDRVRINDANMEYTEDYPVSETQKILNERGKSYGSYDTNALLSQTLKHVMRGSPGWEKLRAHQRESLEMLCVKISRLLNGDPNHLDSWKDAAGYLQLVVIELEKSTT